MKFFLTLLLCTFMAISCDSSHSKAMEECVKIYEDGIVQIQNAPSAEAISNITYDIAKKLAAIGNGPEGEKEMSTKERMAIFEAETRYYQAIEKRSKQLISTPQEPTSQAPIIRNVENK